MNITIICTDRRHPVFSQLEDWAAARRALGHSVKLVADQVEIESGDVLFLVSCSQIIGRAIRARFSATLVLHASRLPAGRGWSPHVWAVLNGEKEITVSLLEAADSVDTGAIWLTEAFKLEGHELLPEINAKLFASELSLMSRAVDGFGSIVPNAQVGDPGTYLKRRTPRDSEIDPHKPLAEQFELLRVVDPDRFPAFFEFREHRYVLKIEKVSKDE